MTGKATLRADAQRNRDKIVSSARAAFAERGLNASLDDIARCAGVGSGTLYRHFPTRDDLISAVFAERMAENVEAVDHALTDPDPWNGFCEYVRRTCRAQSEDRGFADLVAIGHRGSELGERRDLVYNKFVELVGRAQASGKLRSDFTPEDIVLLLMANAGIVERAGAAGKDASERFTALVLDGFRSANASCAPPAVSPIALIVALRESE
jgi:AcrR family transcriptional regulator